MRLISGHRDFGYGVHDYDIPRLTNFKKIAFDRL
jgi:hypothetical protein